MTLISTTPQGFDNAVSAIDPERLKQFGVDATHDLGKKILTQHQGVVMDILASLEDYRELVTVFGDPKDMVDWITLPDDSRVMVITQKLVNHKEGTMKFTTAARVAIEGEHYQKMGEIKSINVKLV